MKVRGWRLGAWLLGMALFTSPPLRGTDEQYRFVLDFGNRWLSGFHGSQDLYRSHLDYGEGPKLFSGDLFISTPQGSDRFFDRFELRMNSWGGEPYNTATLRFGKAGRYDFRFDYKNVQYFNAVPSFANPIFRQGNLDSQHRQDISRRFARFELRLWPGKTLSPFLAYERASGQGPLRTTLSSGGDEFLLASDLDYHSDNVRGGVRWEGSRFSLQLEQGVRWFRDSSRFQASGFQAGNSSRPLLGREITLTDYQARHDVEATIPFSTAVALYRPWDALTLRGRVSYSMASLDSSYLDGIRGTFFSFPLAAFYTQLQEQVPAQVKRPHLFGDFSVEWQPLHRLRLVERIQIRRFHVSAGSLARSTFFNVDPLLELRRRDVLERSDPRNTFLSLDTESLETQALISLTPRLVARLGHRFEQKELVLDQPFAWDRNILIAGFSYEFSLRNRLVLDYELARTDQPLLRTDSLDYHQLRLRGKLSFWEPLEFNGSLTLFDNDSLLETLDFTSHNRDYTLSFHYTPHRRLSVTGEFQRSNVRTSLLVIIPQTFLSDRSLYRERGHYGSLYLSLVLPQEVQLDVGYSVQGTVGNFPMTYHRPMARLEVPLHEQLSAYGQWNYYGYNEKFLLFPQDYRTHLALFGLRLHFGVTD